MTSSGATAAVLDQLNVDEDLSQHLSNPTVLSGWIASVARDLRKEIKELEPLARATAEADNDYKKAHATAFLSTFAVVEPGEGDPPAIRHTESSRKAVADLEASDLYLSWQISLQLFRSKRDAVNALEAVLNGLQTLHRHAANLST
jgi:hypothetical protein